MAFEIVTISAGGLMLRPVSITIAIAHDEAARSFDAKVKHPGMSQAQLLRALAASPKAVIRARKSDGVRFEPGVAGGDLLLTGHVEKRSPRLQSEEGELSISGRSKTGDVVDSSAEHKTGEFKGKKAPEVFSELSKAHGVSVDSDVDHKPRDMFRLKPGEGIWKAAERFARAEGFTISDTPEGNLKFSKGAKKRHAGALSTRADVWPRIEDASAVHDDSKRFSKVKVKAQAPDGYKPAAMEIEDEAKDEGISRHRLRIIVPPEEVKKKDARERAKWHRDRAAGEGTTCEVTVVGWRDSAGTLWTPGHLITVDIPDLDIMQDMMIKSVSLEQSDAGNGGTRTKLSLVDPRAFGGKSGKGSKSGKQWDLGKAGADDV